MTQEQRAELAAIRAEQQKLRAALTSLEARLDRLVAAPAPAVELSPPPLPPAAAASPIPLVPQLQPSLPPPLPAREENLEVRLGAKWFVRIAVFMLVAALAFLANYLYQNVIPHLGPAAKVGLLYLGSGALTGFGLWLERSRQSRENAGVLNYARVVLAGGLVAVYYVTYAAHHYEPLRVIDSDLLAGLLLLGWTAFMTWLAERRRSQTLAAFSILLAYFASATSDVAGFTLVANLGLTAAAVFLVLRQRWTAFSFASLAATYGSYAFWRYGGLLNNGVSLPLGGSGLWTEGAFLACYWALFTVAAFLDRRETLGGAGIRASFISLNNGAFFALVGLLVHDLAPGSFWKWSLGLGATLLAVGELSRRTSRKQDQATVDAYHFGGIGLVTLSLILYFSGWQLSVILAVESATVLAASRQRRSWPMFVAAYGVALISTFVAFAQIAALDGREHWLPPLACGAIFILNAWQGRRFPEARASVAEGFYSLLGLGLWYALLETQITAEVWRAPVLAGAAAGLTAAFSIFRLPMASAMAQLYLLGAYWHWLSAYGAARQSSLPPLWNPGALLAVTVALGAVADRFKRHLSLMYEAAAFTLFALVAVKYFDGAEQFTLFVVASAATLGLGCGTAQSRLRWWSLALAASALLSFAAPPYEAGWDWAPGILLLAGLQQFARRFGRARAISSARYEGALISFAALCAWAWITRRLHHGSWASFTLAASWSVYGGALFALGIALREQAWRWWGLGVLATALAHLVILDIWTLGNLERFVSLFVISLVLLAIGFFYNRLSSSIREWL